MKIQRISDRIFSEAKKKSILKIEDILSALDIPYIIKSKYMINILCPVHGSTDYGSSSIRLADGVWKCWSRSCNQDVGNNFIHLIKWCLSQKQKTVWQDVIDFINNPTFQSVERTIQNQTIEENVFDVKTYPEIITPSKYYTSRNFNKDILSKFNIGDCYTGRYANRAIVPVKNKSSVLLGFSARSIYEKCNKCNYYHSPFQMCINNSNKYANTYKKWAHSYGLRTSLALYNIERAQGDKIAIVEGPSCVWRLDEFGVNGVACLGKEFTVGHKNLLQSCGVKRILFISDNDEAGKAFRNKFVHENIKNFEIYFPKAMTNKDVTEMKYEDIENNIISVWEKI